MMNTTGDSFYYELANSYDQVFPLNQASLSFVQSYLLPEANIIMDIGCATGQLSLHLAQLKQPGVKKVVAVDPDEKMIEILKQRIQLKGLAPNIQAQVGGMLELDSLTGPESIHTILCLGNTLVHLQSLEEIEQFISSAFVRLKRSGSFIFQIVNYTRIFKQNVTQLPFIDKPGVSLKREYKLNDDHTRIRFQTQMILKESNKVMNHETLLFPLQLTQVKPVIKKSGFHISNCYGDFNRQPWYEDSPALVMVLKKP